jgi:hypothetical protein
LVAFVVLVEVDEDVFAPEQPDTANPTAAKKSIAAKVPRLRARYLSRQNNRSPVAAKLALAVFNSEGYTLTAPSACRHSDSWFPSIANLTI